MEICCFFLEGGNEVCVEGEGWVKVQLRQIVNSYQLTWKNLEFSTSCQHLLEGSTFFSVTS